jgi:hypothetical protein
MGSVENFNDFAREQGAPESVLEREYQLSYDDVTPRRWYLSVNGSEAKLNKSNQLNEQRSFRNWCLDHGHKPPMTEKTPIFELMMGRLFNKASKREGTLPFFQTDAGNIENFEHYFGGHIPSMVRAKGDEFLTGGVGDYVRVRVEANRVYFKWQKLKRWSQRALNLNERDLDALKTFISAKGGYQGEEGERGWFRWTYWTPLDVFDGAVVWQWLHPDEKQE